MKALVNGGPSHTAWDHALGPVVVDHRPGDAVTICCTDLHIFKCDVPAVAGGRIFGIEARRHQRALRRSGVKRSEPLRKRTEMSRSVDVRRITTSRAFSLHEGNVQMNRTSHESELSC
jgi:hypothetical protein